MISALVVSHNSQQHLPRCLASLCSERQRLAGRGEELEIVVVDNGSADASVAVAREHDTSIRVLELRENVGFARANNRGAEATSGGPILLLNPDARLENGAVGALSHRLGSEPQLGLVAPRLVSSRGLRQFSWSPDVGVVGEALQRLRNLLPGPGRGDITGRFLKLCSFRGWYTAACLLIRRDAWHAVMGFDERFFLYFEDADLCHRLRRAGWRSAFAADAVVVHEGSAGLRAERERLGERPSSIEEAYRRSQILYYEKHRPRWEQRVLRSHLRRKYRHEPELLQRVGLLAGGEEAVP